jgi:hypothetical protein
MVGDVRGPGRRPQIGFYRAVREYRKRPQRPPSPEEPRGYRPLTPTPFQRFHNTTEHQPDATRRNNKPNPNTRRDYPLNGMALLTSSIRCTVAP